MMTTDWTQLAPWALTFVAFVLLACQGVINSRRIARVHRQLRENSENLVRELNATASGSAGVGNRLIVCERQLHELRSLFDEMRQNDPLRVSYDEASRLVVSSGRPEFYRENRTGLRFSRLLYLACRHPVGSGPAGGRQTPEFPR